MNWIDLEKELPPNGVDVLCCFIGWDDMVFQRVLSYDEDENYFDDWNGVMHEGITHWTYLPKAPQI